MSSHVLDKNKIRQLLNRNVEKVIEREHLEKALRSGRKLRVKLGIDPTGEKIHIGRAIVIWKLREFQELGHQAVLIIGDFTAQIGDASDKQAARRPLLAEEVRRNMRDYRQQIGKILDWDKTEVRYNSEWLGKLSAKDILNLGMNFTAQQMIHRRNFEERWREGKPIGLHELNYPLLQGYDSVAVKADVELGGFDQLFNLKVGREIQRRFGQEPQDILTTRMLLGTDGRKMSTSWGNVINISDSPEEQLGKVMAMRDEIILDYFRLATRLADGEIAAYRRQFEGGANPRDIKIILAKEIVTLYHGRAAAEKAAARWEKLFSKKETLAAELPVIVIPSGIIALDLVLRTGGAQSRSAAWRLIKQGGLKVNGKTIPDPKQKLSLKSGEIVRVGKKRFFRVA